DHAARISRRIAIRRAVEIETLYRAAEAFDKSLYLSPLEMTLRRKRDRRRPSGRSQLRSQHIARAKAGEFLLILQHERSRHDAQLVGESRLRKRIGRGHGSYSLDSTPSPIGCFMPTGRRGIWTVRNGKKLNWPC